MTIRSVIFWPHLIAGISAGIVVLIMSVTGVLLTYERQMIAWSDRGFSSEPARAGESRLPIETLIAQFREARLDVVPTAVTVRSAPEAPVAFAVPPRTLYVNAYTGAVLGEASQTVRRFMTELRAWHRWLAVDGEGRPVARAITGWANVVFLFIVVSGFYLWFPRKWTWKHVRTVTLFNRGLKGKARDFNWHNTIGFWSAVPLFIVVLCATPISFPWANALVYRAVGEAPPAPAGGGNQGQRREAAPSIGGLNALWARAEQQVPDWRSINMRIPTGDAPVVFAIDRGDGGQPQLRSTLTLDPRTGNVVSDERFADLTPGRRIRNVMRFAHTGEVLGIAGQTVAGLVSGGGAVLVWTGLALAFRRLRAWLKRRAERTVSIPASTRVTPVPVFQTENQQ